MVADLHKDTVSEFLFNIDQTHKSSILCQGNFYVVSRISRYNIEGNLLLNVTYIQVKWPRFSMYASKTIFRWVGERGIQ